MLEVGNVTQAGCNAPLLSHFWQSFRSMYWNNLDEADEPMNTIKKVKE